MKNLFVRFLACFIPNREKRRRFRADRMENSRHEPVVHGEGNVIVNCPSGVNLTIFGNGNRIEFREPVGAFCGTFMIGRPSSPVSNVRVIVGERTECAYMTMWVLENDSVVRIGRDCLISAEVQVWCTDAHAMFDDDGRLLNGGAHSITIGDHCWIGLRACLLKGTVLENDVIVGMNTVVAGGKRLSSNCVYVGSPARCVREHIHWDSKTPQHFMNENHGLTK